MPFLYGWLVNRPSGALLGIYIVLFFLISQVVAFAVFGAHRRGPILIGDASSSVAAGR